jgi:FkbM family methyltransferase
MPNQAVARFIEFARDIKAIPRLIQGKSFSQYAEDDILFAALSPQRNGFYVDVGAHNPKQGSNTYRLYRRGWSGITIEPNPVHATEFRSLRPRDIHLTIGISEKGGELRYYEYENSVLNTFSEERRNDLAALGRQVIATRSVPTAPLSELIKPHAGGRPIDLLSVDCEGFDLVVLKTCDFALNRPSAIIVEDFEGFHALRTGTGDSEIATFLRANQYEPISQALFSSLYVARDWEALFKRRDAFKPIQTTLLPH